MDKILQVVPLFFSVFKEANYYNKTEFNMESDKEIISRLKFIGKIQKGEKINVKYMYVQQEGVATRISRTLINQCNRQSCLLFLKNTINRSFELVHSYKLSSKKEDQITRLNILKDLRISKEGISNLKDTYKEDLKILCDFDTLIEHIDSKLAEIGEDMNNTIQLPHIPDVE